MYARREVVKLKCGTHIAAGSATLLAAWDAYALGDAGELPEAVGMAAVAAGKFMADGGGLPGWLAVPCGLLLFLLGCELPDVDHQYSPIGKIVHIPVAHRTWTHSLWFVLLLGVPGIWFRPMAWLAAGCLTHLFYDMFSMSGIHWLYPYRKKRHVLKLYHTGDLSEYVVGTIVVLASLALTGYTLWTLFRPGPKFI